MYRMIYIFLSVFGGLLSTSIAQEPEFRLRSRYVDNDYSAEDRDVIEGFRMSFVPPKWECVIVTTAQQTLDRKKLADDSADYQDASSTEADNTNTITSDESVSCPTVDIEYEDEEKEEHVSQTITDKTTKTDYFVEGILQRGEQICGVTTTTQRTTINSDDCVTNSDTTMFLSEGQTFEEYEYNDGENTENNNDATWNYAAEEDSTEKADSSPNKLQCRHEHAEQVSSTTMQETESIYVPQSIAETNKIGTLTSIESLQYLNENNNPEEVPYSPCVINEVNLNQRNEQLKFPQDSYVGFIVSDDPNTTKNTIKEDATKVKWKHAKEQHLARKRRLHKRIYNARHWDEDHSILNDGFIDNDHVAFEGDLNIPYSDQFVHKSTINISKVPSESDEDTLGKSVSLKDYVHENFWLKNEEKTRVREIHARNMKKYIDFSVNPCDDFFQYACGNWYKFNPIPADRNNYDTFDLLRESLDYILKELLEDKEIDKAVNVEDKIWKGLHPVYRTKSRRTLVPDYYEADDDFYLRKKDDLPAQKSPLSTNYNEETEEATIKAKYMFSSCMNTEMLKKRGVQPALDLISKLGGWPILDANWEPKDYEFEWLLAQLRLYNNDILLSEWVGSDIRNSKEYIIQIDQTTLGLPSREYYLEDGNEQILEAYQNYIMAVGLGMGANESTIEDDASDILAFEIELASITVPNDVRRNVSEIYIRFTVNELHQLIPQFNWLRYFRLVSDNYVEADDEVVLYCIQYIRSMIELISQTDVRTTTNYLLWRFMRHRVNNLDDRFQVAKQRFYKVVFGKENQLPRWQTCIMQVNSNMGMAVGNLFVSKYYTKQSKDDTLHMTKYIREAFADILKDTTWLDPITTNLALIKLAAMRLTIGYPNYILNRRKLNKRYSDVQVHPRYYFENTLSILQHLTRLEHFKLKRQVDKNVWNSAPAVVNAYYSRNKNQIIFPAGILQPPFYHRHFPKSMNFGGIGIVMGHEMTHGFDDKGRLFDKEGNLKNWWKDESIEEFHERTQCLIEQYDHYLVPEANMQLDGESTQGENIADNGGLKQAFLAYQYWLKDNEDKRQTETLPGLNMTNMQLFFLNFAQIWCGDMRAEAAVTKLPGAIHSPGRFRVIGSVSNSEEFAAVFNCPAPAPMNPDDKCTIW